MNNTQTEHRILVNHNNTPMVYVLNNKPFSIGRHSSNSLTLKSKFISRCHATILPLKSKETENKLFWIIDGNEQGMISTNGIKVNDETCISQELHSGDKIMLPDGTKIAYQIYDKSQDCDPDENITTESFSEKDEKQNQKNDFKIKTEFHEFLPCSHLETRICVQSLDMLNLLLEKEFEVARSQDSSLALIFLYYDLNNLKQQTDESYQKILRLYQLNINKQIHKSYDFILSFENLEVVILHTCSHKKINELAMELEVNLKEINEKMNLNSDYGFILGAYSQIPQCQRNARLLVDEVSEILTRRAKSYKDNKLFINLNLSKETIML